MITAILHCNSAAHDQNENCEGENLIDGNLMFDITSLTNNHFLHFNWAD